MIKFLWIGLLVLVVEWVIVVELILVLLEKVECWNFWIIILVILFFIVWGVKVLEIIVVIVFGIWVKLVRRINR